MNRIDKKFLDLRRKGRKAFIAFITVGDPNLATTVKLILELEKRGVDIVELGVPFSDPLADGPTIQASSQRALKNRITLKKVLKLTGDIRKRSNIPLALMTYYNPIFRYGQDKFIRDAVQAGLDGVIIPDLPPEEARVLTGLARKHKFDIIFFLSPTSSLNRIKLIAKTSKGFIYYVSLTGVTGARKRLPKNLLENLKTIKTFTTKPVCVGFGISRTEQVAMLAKVADGVIVGSAIVEVIEKSINKVNLVEKVGNFVSGLLKYKCIKRQS
jgi:tryptophan synthase alpha chain